MKNNYNSGKILKSKLNENPFQASLFWNNLPKPYGKNLGFLEEAINRYKAIPIKTPYFVFTGMDKIDLDWIKNDVSLVRALKKNIIHFYLYEPVIYNIEDRPYNLTYYSEWHNSKNKKLLAVELEHIDKFAKDIDVKISVHTCDYNIRKYFHKTYKNLDLVVDDLFIKLNSKPFYGATTRKKITKRFWAANARYAPHRHLIMTYLADKDGMYSWYFDADVVLAAKTHDWIEEDKLPWDTLNKNNNILNNSQFTIDIEVPKISMVDYSVTMTPSQNGFSRGDDYVNSFTQCFCAIVNETRYAQPTGNFSEKTFSPIMTKTPFIVVAPPYTLKYLKELGFKTFSNYWDESYDEEENHTDRLLKIYDVIDYIDSLSIKECKKMYKSMADILRYNYNLISHNRITGLRLYR